MEKRTATTNSISGSNEIPNPAPQAISPVLGEKIMLVFASGFPSTDPLEQVFRDWFKKIQTDTGGRVQISVLDTFGLANEKGGIVGFASFQEMREHIDILWAIYDMLGGSFPLQRALGSFVYGTDIAGSLYACTRTFEEFPEMQAEFTNRNMKRLVAFAAEGPHIQTVAKPVRIIDDLRGLRISGIGFREGVFSQLGVIDLPSGGSMQEYSVFSKDRGEAPDGVLTIADFLWLLKGYEVIRYSTDLHIPYPTVDNFVMKLETWNSLPADIQKIMKDSLPWFYEEINRVQPQVKQKYIDWAKAKGVEFIELPEEELSKLFKVCEKAAIKVAADLDTKGLPGTKIFLRARQLIDEYNGTK